MGVIRFKIWRDLWANKGRTLVVVLIIGLGAAAVGMIVTTRNLMIGFMSEGWRSSNPAMISLFAYSPVGDETIEVLRRIEGLEDVEGYARITVEWRLRPDEEWRPAGLTARTDYYDQSYARLELVEGVWPEDEGMGAGRSTASTFGVPRGSWVQIRANDRVHELVVTGMMDDQTAFPPNVPGGTAQFYLTREAFEDVSGLDGLNFILARGPIYDVPALTSIADKMQRKLERQGVDSSGGSPFGERVSDPERHYFQATMDAVFLVLGVLAVLALMLSLLLVYNTISSIISQQIDQIGIMKAIGARTGQILLTYLLMVLGYSILALAIALPLGSLGGHALASFLVVAFNAEPGAFEFDKVAVVAMLAVILVAPFGAALIPIISGSRVTVNQAINTYGLQADPGMLDKSLARIQRVPRLVLLTISNTFRKKGRVFLTQITLVLSGVIFMMVMSARDSAAYTYGDVLFSILKFDVSMPLDEPQRNSHVEEVTLAHPDVKAVEMWALSSATVRPAGQPAAEDDDSALLFGVPLPTELYGYQMRQGRWLMPEDEYAIVLNEQLAGDVGVGVGDWVTFDHGVTGESTWRVVGLLFDPILSTSGHVPREPVLRELGSAGKSSVIMIQTMKDDPESQIAAAKSLRQYLPANQLELNPGSVFGGADTAGEITGQQIGFFGVIVTLLMVMALVIAMVGGIALSGALSLNVIERRREIGVMRAIGASSANIGFLFVGEGLLLGLLSWLIAVPLSIPAGRAMSEAMGQALGGGMVYKFTPVGAIMWLVIVILLALVASWLPVRSAVGISVRESLSYQ
jgi:putative ABC transport system permease protein